MPLTTIQRQILEYLAKAGVPATVPDIAKETRGTGPTAFNATARSLGVLETMGLVEWTMHRKVRCVVITARGTTRLREEETR